MKYTVYYFNLCYSVSVRINDTVTFVEDGFDEDIEFGDEISDEGEGDPVDNVSWFWLQKINAINGWHCKIVVWNLFLFIYKLYNTYFQIFKEISSF